MSEPMGEFLLYETEDGKTRVECRFAGESLWLLQAPMAELFQTTPQNITLHLKALYAEGEIDPSATCKPYLQVRSEGGRSVSGDGSHLAKARTFRKSKTPHRTRVLGELGLQMSSSIRTGSARLQPQRGNCI